MKMKEKLYGYIYQYIVLIAVIILLGVSFLRTGEFNEILLGALVGVMASLPANDKNKGVE